MRGFLATTVFVGCGGAVEAFTVGWINGTWVADGAGMFVDGIDVGVEARVAVDDGSCTDLPLLVGAIGAEAVSVFCNACSSDAVADAPAETVAAT